MWTDPIVCSKYKNEPKVVNINELSDFLQNLKNLTNLTFFFQIDNFMQLLPPLLKNFLLNDKDKLFSKSVQIFQFFIALLCQKQQQLPQFDYFWILTKTVKIDFFQKLLRG